MNTVFGVFTPVDRRMDTISGVFTPVDPCVMLAAKNIEGDGMELSQRLRLSKASPVQSNRKGYRLYLSAGIVKAFGMQDETGRWWVTVIPTAQGVVLARPELFDAVREEQNQAKAEDLDALRKQIDEEMQSESTTEVDSWNQER